MPFVVDDPALCEACNHGHCVIYIREQSKRMKDRDTQYRIVQNNAMACAFDSWVPGFAEGFDEDRNFNECVDQLVSNSVFAGRSLEKLEPNFFGTVEKDFFVTPQQIGKVRGDVFEMVCRAILWNACAVLNRRLAGLEDLKSLKVPRALDSVFADSYHVVLTLGDNYDLKRLFTAETAKSFASFESALKERGTALCYSTPDIIGLRFQNPNEELKALLTTTLHDVGTNTQTFLHSLRNLFEGQLQPDQVVFAAGLKTSIRSDRMYQLLFEANAWKFVWRAVFEETPSKYYSLITQSYGANPEKLHAVEFSDPKTVKDNPVRAIDALVTILTPGELVEWFVAAIEKKYD